MRRVVIPLDGTEHAAAILPDARRLAGPGGKLILIHDATVIPYSGFTYLNEQEQALEASDAYLQEMAERLRSDGVGVQTHTTVAGNAALAIQDATRIFHADMVAVATHARSGVGRIVHGSIAWRALAHSSVPILVRHVRNGKYHFAPVQPLDRSILVPLDGSSLAEKALPLAQDLAREWHAEIRIVQVIQPPRGEPGTFGMGVVSYEDTARATREAEAYLAQIAGNLDAEVHKHVLIGSPVDALTAAAEAWLISDIIMASHGRTGPSRVILGSVTDALIHHLDIPIIVTPVRAPEFATRELQGVSAEAPE